MHREYSAAMDNKRTLLGMQRVGPLAMDLMLTNERRAHVVLTSARRPTHKMLNDVADKTVEMLKYTQQSFLRYQDYQKDIKTWHEQKDEEEAETRKMQEEMEKAQKEQDEANAKEKEENGENQDAEEGDKKEEDSGEKEEVEKEKASEEDKNESKGDMDTSNDFNSQWAGGWAPLTGPEAASKAAADAKPVREDPEYYTISKEPQNSGFLITYGVVQPNKMIIRVTITSTLLRNDVTERKSAEAEAEGQPIAKRIKEEAPQDPNEHQKMQAQAEEKENKADEEKKDGEVEGEDKKAGEEAEGEEKKDENTEAASAEASKPAEDGWQSMSGGWQAMEKEAPKFPTEEEMKQFNFGPYSKTMTMEDCEIMEKEQGPLPTQPGLGALAELRRIKWYQHIGLSKYFFIRVPFYIINNKM